MKLNTFNNMRECISGHKLLHKQSDVPIKGWAVECRVYAEVMGLFLYLHRL